MGKLHTLRRAIEREPQKWMWGHNQRRAYGASFWRGTWSPHYSITGVPYRKFVRSVLQSLGYTIE